LDVAKELIKLSGQGYDYLLIPCRGAFPVLVGAIEMLKLIDGRKDLLARFFAPYPHPILREYHKKSGDFKILILPVILPFTVHVTIPDEYRQKYDFKETIDAVESSVRLWATNLALSLPKECDERSKDDYFNLYTKLLNLTGQPELEEL
jgi:hypothetical protein